MFCAGSYHVPLAAVLCKSLSLAWMVVAHGFHADWDKRMAVVVVRAVEVSIRGYFWVDVCLH